eukprot:g4023.t1
MPFASLRNAEKRRTHRERSQPKKRRRLGLLEKHGDYVKRARNYESKRKRIEALQRKAADRNPDEFNFGMLKSKTKNGIHVVRDDRGKLSAEMHMLVKTQDLTYATISQSREKKKIEKMKANLHFQDGAGAKKGKHTIFVDSVEDAKKFDGTKYFDTTAESLAKTVNRRRKVDLEKDAENPIPSKTLRKIERRRERAYTELKERTRREKKLSMLRSHLQLHKNLSGKGRRRKVKDAEGSKPAVYKWKQQRSR